MDHFRPDVLRKERTELDALDFGISWAFLSGIGERY